MFTLWECKIDPQLWLLVLVQLAEFSREVENIMGGKVR